MAPAPKTAGQPSADESVSRHTETSRQLRWILFWISLAIGAAILAGIGGFAAASFQPPSYGARAEIALYASDLAELPEQYLATQTLFVRSNAVLGPVAETFQVSADGLAEALSVDFPEGGALMRIQYVDRDRTIAIQRLTAIVSAYLSKLGQLESRQNIRHDVLVPPFILEEPVRPRPLQVAALGGAAGLTIIIVAFVLVSARENKVRQA
jgi:hypothetical protein